MLVLEENCAIDSVKQNNEQGWLMSNGRILSSPYHNSQDTKGRGGRGIGRFSCPTQPPDFQVAGDINDANDDRVP
jgi:hypothetical protein